MVVLLLMIAACVSLGLYAFQAGTSLRVNLLGLGLFFWALAVTLPMLFVLR